MKNLIDINPKKTKELLDQVDSVIESAKRHVPRDKSLKSSEKLIRLIDSLDSQRNSTNANEKLHFLHLRKILSDCDKYERKLQDKDITWTKTPADFMRDIEKKQIQGLRFSDLKLKKQAAENELQDFIDNAQKNKSLDEVSDERIQQITNTLSKLISNKENYRFIEDTEGFFCTEVLSEYRKHLLTLLKNKAGEDNPEVFTVERMQ